MAVIYCIRLVLRGPHGSCTGQRSLQRDGSATNTKRLSLFHWYSHFTKFIFGPDARRVRKFGVDEDQSVKH